MRRELCVLNLFLLALVAVTSRQLHNRWLAENTRESPAPVSPTHVPLFMPTPNRTAVVLADYADIAQKDLFDPSRNPAVIVEEPPAPPSPPRPPRPPLPFLYGEMNLGDGPIAILSLNPGAPQHATRPGEMIGPFRLIDVTRQYLTLEWDDQLLRISIDDLTNRGGPPAALTVTTSRTEASPREVHQAPAASASGPAINSSVSRTCTPNDNTQVGTVQDGLRKTRVQTPFGSACLWSPVGKFE